MSSPPMDSHRLRLLLVLAILKCKPVNMTCFAYIHSLRSSFPDGQSRDGDNGLGNEIKWKERADRLEKECEALKKTLEAMGIQTFLANHPPKSTREATPQTTETPSNAPTNKKKGKQKQQSLPAADEAHRPSFDLKTILEQLETREANRKSVNDARLFEVLDTFFALSALHGQPDFPEKAFISATRRAIDSVAISVDWTIKQDMSLERIQTLDSLIRLIIEKSLPIITVSSDAPSMTMTLGSASGSGDCINSLAAFLDQLSTAILVPILRSFFLLSEQLLARLLLGKDHDKSRSKISADAERTARSSFNHVDGRPALLALFHSALGMACATLSSLARAQFASTAKSKPASTASTKTREKKARARIDIAKNSLVELSLMHHSLTLEAIRLLDRMFFEDLPKTKMDSQDYDAPTSRKSRVLRLAVKDTVWYLCSTIHFVINSEISIARLLESDDFTTQSEDDFHPYSGNLAASRLGVLKKTVLDNFIGLVTLQHHKSRTGRLETTSDMHSTTERSDGSGGNGELIDRNLRGDPLDEDQIQDGGMTGTGNMQGFGSRISSSPYLVNDGQLGHGAGSETDIIPIARIHILLDDMERRMILRVVESYFNIT